MTKELLLVQFTLKYFLLAAGTQDLGYEGLNGRWEGSICRLYIQIFDLCLLSIEFKLTISRENDSLLIIFILYLRYLQSLNSTQSV